MWISLQKQNQQQAKNHGMETNTKLNKESMKTKPEIVWYRNENIHIKKSAEKKMEEKRIKN